MLTPIGQWGGRTVTALPALYLEAGGFQYNPNYATRHGSFELDGTGHLGYMYIFELGYLPAAGTVIFPGTGKLAAGTTQRMPMMYWMTTMAIPMSSHIRLPGNTVAVGGYFYVSQQLTHSGSQRQNGLNIFGHLAINDKNTATMDYQIRAGVIYKGPFASRPQDFICFGVSKCMPTPKSLVERNSRTRCEDR